MSELTLPDDEIRELLQRGMDENGHRRGFHLQVSTAIYERMRVAGLLPAPHPTRGVVAIMIVNGWHPDLLGGCWDGTEP